MKPYLTQTTSQALRIRWISVQCYEIILPNGKVIVTDPFYLDASIYDEMTELTKSQKMERDVYSQTGFSVDNFTGADYILLNHVHGDHCNLVGELWNKFYGRILCPAECCEELAKTFDIPYGTIYPLYPNNTYYFDDFTLKTYPGAHDNRSFREGRFRRPGDPKDQYAGLEGFGVPCPSRLGGLGSIFNLNYVIETQQNFKIDFSAGRDYEEHVKHLTEEKPNLMLRHRIRSNTPEYCAQQIMDMGAQLMMPLHHNNARATGEDLNEYFEKVNEILVAKGSPARAFNPEPYRWYTINLSILADA
ncbi:MAG: MBL fold metallo-hydrolase [Lachnospiraceae bacterium]|nr:MBL fold metallo-hydrolase [Lachnospiraceae bacterium]